MMDDARRCDAPHAQVQGQSCHFHGCEPEAYICCMFVDTKTKLGILLNARKITFGVKSRVRYVPDLSL
jgi:hypothetical protein